MMFNSNSSEISNYGNVFGLNQIKTGGAEFFNQQITEKYFLNLLSLIDKEYKNYTCFPQQENIFYIFRKLDSNDIKVVIFGQDPYHTPGIADGIAFSTQKENFLPQSLRNIFIELKRDLKCSNFVLSSQKGNLSSGLDEGVFLLNVALTVRQKEAGSHLDLGELFTNNLIEFLIKKNKQIIGVFWGRQAKNIKEKHDFDDDFCLTSAHPSPFSAHKGFFFSSPFSKINKKLAQIKKKTINWLIINE